MIGDPRADEMVSGESIAKAPTPQSRRKLLLLQSVLHPTQPIQLDTVRDDHVFVSDVSWKAAKVGWGKPARNHYWFDDEIRDAVLLNVGGQFYEKGLYAHSPARYVFAVDEKWKTFSATIGLQDGAQPQGSAIFSVRGDGQQLFRSRLLRAGGSQKLDVNIAGVKELELVTEGGEGHPHSSWAMWAEPMLQR
jgi:hypothetical protein